ncbi:LysR family transcriptional regulator ArgP [Cellulomonas sp. KRMCY2]|uniref:LysR family transcriptional regulator ArgP n=1 Tax=Cellulomonas sp. KRMCY2 TaxID=1304865 RepID=UPI00045E697B|nr:LysR family transcriptional regulator ArgP [Cellulomonas sp. KRMCY2]
MEIDGAQLAALAAVVDEGTFEAAARRLHVTPSAVSQRVKGLEQAMGQVLVRRSRPCRATDAGHALVRLAGQTALLQSEALVAVRGVTGAAPRVSVAVNADSLSTWFPAAIAELPIRARLDLRREDQDHSAELLRDGSVMAAVTADPQAVQGCRVRPLGAMRYLPVGSPSYVTQWFGGGLDPAALAVAPLLTFNRKDALQVRFLRQVSRRPLEPPVHYVPSSSAFVELVRRGLGWGMVPDVAAAPLLADGELVVLAPGRHLDIPLYWQHWKLESAVLDALTTSVVAAAREVLHGP